MPGKGMNKGMNPAHGSDGGPSWKPDKSTTEGNYGQAVSEAARGKPKPAMPEEGQHPSQPGRGKPRG